MAEILNDTSENILKACAILRSGALLAIPTETVYGLAANAFDEKAVYSIFKAKGRPFIDPLIVHIYSFEQLEMIANVSSSYVKKLTDAFWPGPLTLILPKKKNIPDVVTAGEPTVAVRMPNHPIARKILKTVELPLAAPSANPFGYVSPTSAQHVQDSLGNKIDAIFDGGECSCGIESTILWVGDRLQILRPGVITKEEIESVVNVPVFMGVGHLEKKANELDSKKGEIAPGLLKRHYSPKANLYLVDKIKDCSFVENIAFVFQVRPQNMISSKNIFWLSENGDQKEVAKNVFALLRRLDNLNFTTVYLERSPDIGVGHAVNDRLSRAGKLISQ